MQKIQQLVMIFVISMMMSNGVHAMKRSHYYISGDLIQIVEGELYTELLKDIDAYDQQATINHIAVPMPEQHAERAIIKEFRKEQEAQYVLDKQHAEAILMQEFSRALYDQEKQTRIATAAFMQEQHAKREQQKKLKKEKEVHSLKYYCSTCNFVTSHEVRMEAHNNIHALVEGYPSIKPYHCEECDYLVLQKKPFMDHQISHQKEKEHECPRGCGSTFKLERSMKRHLKISKRCRDKDLFIMEK